jgi:5-methylcytosine-specific restriction endonuclease McrA
MSVINIQVQRELKERIWSYIRKDVGESWSIQKKTILREVPKKLPILMWMQNNHCAYCGCFFSKNPNSDRAASIDHVIAKSRGGFATWENVLASCRLCNSNVKGNKNFLRFILRKVRKGYLLI